MKGWKSQQEVISDQNVLNIPSYSRFSDDIFWDFVDNGVVDRFFGFYKRRSERRNNDNEITKNATGFESGSQPGLLALRLPEKSKSQIVD